VRSFRAVRRPAALLLTLLALIAVALGGCGSSSSSSKPSATPAPTATTTAGAGSAPGCHAVSVPAPKGPQQIAKPAIKLDPRKAFMVTVVTNCGTFAIRLDQRHWPKTAASFAYLVRRGFYDGLTFHRVSAGFVIQGGDPLGDGSGGPGYTVVEPPPTSTQYAAGDVAMAKTQTEPRGASGSQFFVVTAANASATAGLTPDYALVGKVVSGMAVVQAIGALPTNPPQDGAPSPAVVMSRVTLSQ
jgi:cyclophilin family peptidyl-prolyl cis-trans isomerase